MPRIVGIDPSLTRTGICVMFGGAAYCLSVRSGQAGDFARSKDIVSRIAVDVLRRDDIVVMEAIGVARFMPHAGKIVERLKMVGMLELLSVRKTGLPCLAVPPTMMKSFVAGSGAAQKADVLRAVREVWKAGPENHDEADAFGFAAVAREYFSGGRTDQKMMRKFARYGENAEALRRIRFVFGDRFSPC